MKRVAVVALMTFGLTAPADACWWCCPWKRCCCLPCCGPAHGPAPGPQQGPPPKPNEPPAGDQDDDGEGDLADRPDELAEQKEIIAQHGRIDKLHTDIHTILATLERERGLEVGQPPKPRDPSAVAAPTCTTPAPDPQDAGGTGEFDAPPQAAAPAAEAPSVPPRPSPPSTAAPAGTGGTGDLGAPVTQPQGSAPPATQPAAAGAPGGTGDLGDPAPPPPVERTPPPLEDDSAPGAAPPADGTGTPL